MALAGTSTTPCPNTTGTSASLRTWRSGRLPAGSSAASLRGEASLVDASASTRGLRAVRLSRINPTFPQMERLDESRNSCDSGVEDPETAPSMLIQAPKQPPAATLPFQKGLVTTDDLAAESKQKWPLSLAARPAMWEGLDTQGLSATSGTSRGAASRRVQGHLGLRRLPGQPLGPFERDKLLDSFNQFRQNGGHLPSMASSTSHFSRGVDLLDVQSHDMEALQQRCAELEALVTELKRTKRRTSKPTSTSSTVSLPGTPGGTCTPSTAPEQDTEDFGKIASRVEQAEHRAEVLAAELAAASARLAEAEDGANAKVANAAASLRASEAACLAAVEAAQDANEARRRVEEELTKEAAIAKKASSDEMAEAAAAREAMEEMRNVKLRAATFRSKALAMQEMRADSQELAMLASCFAAWRLWRADNRISSAQDVIEAQANEIGRVASLQARQRVRHGIESALKSTEVEVMHTVIAAWRTSLCTRRTVGSLQAALFAEEADRASALRAQRSECDVLLLQAEARHRIALQKLRTELAEAQAKQKEASAAERLALQAAVRAESIGWPSPLDLPDTEDAAVSDHPSSPETE